MNQQEPRISLSRREYDDWVLSAASLALALGYPVRPEMINEGTGIVFGDDQYAAFVEGLWEPTAYELMIIFEALNEPGVEQLPRGSEPFAEYGGLCDKLMILHPGKYCPPHFHPRKTESYEVVMGEMEVFYGHEPASHPDERLNLRPMPAGDPWPEGVQLAAGREQTYERLTSYKRLRRGDPKFVMHRNHLHAFRCPPDSLTPLVVREISTYSHEPTDAAAGRDLSLAHWSTINDNTFLAEGANSGRLRVNISN